MRQIISYCFIALLLYCFIGFVFPSPALAQECGIEGIVSDSNGNPSSGVIVVIWRTGAGGAWIIGETATDWTGYYYLPTPCNTSLRACFNCPQEPEQCYNAGSTPSSGKITFSPPSPFSCELPPTPSPSPSPGPSPSPSPSPSPTLPPYPPDYSPAGALHCAPEADGDPDSRPYRNVGPKEDPQCDLCNMTSMYCSSCATSFTVGTTVQWQWFQKNCENGGIWWIAEWGGTVTIDPTETTIPFVGKKQNEDERLYLADYFDGTNEYYKEKTNKYHQYWLDWVNHAGVWRKLTPMEYQDELKKQMVERAVAATDELREGNIHNYEVDFIGRVCWDLPFFADVFIAIVNKHLGAISYFKPAIDKIVERAHSCVFSGDIPGPTLVKDLILAFNRIIDDYFGGLSLLKITYYWGPAASDRLASLDGHFPPEADEEDYLEKWREWKKSPWGRLWTATPMSSREDTPGWIQPYYAYKYQDEPKNFDPRVEKVPHVARLYESTLDIQDILFPSLEEGLTSQKETEPACYLPKSSQPIIASPGEEKVMGEKVLLAQAKTWHLGAYASYSAPYVYVTVCFESDSCDGDIMNFYANGVRTAGPNPWRLADGPFCYSGQYTLSPYVVSPGQSITVCFSGELKNTACTNYYDTICCTFSVDDDGNFETTCGPGGPPAPPTCEIPPSTISVPNCAQDSITDDNPNDDLCCEEISLGPQGPMTFRDSFYDHNPDDYLYMECIYEEVCECPGGYVCDENGENCFCAGGEVCHDELINPECKTWVHKEVSRRWGIYLSHPYLTQVWEQTALNETSGLFNIFRPAEIPEFEELDAHSFIDYEFTGGWERPSDGKFYFNYLGGVQKAKEWVTTKELMPYIE